MRGSGVDEGWRCRVLCLSPVTRPPLCFLPCQDNTQGHRKLSYRSLPACNRWRTWAERRQASCPRSQDALAQEQTLELLDVLFCLLSTVARCPGCAVHPWDLSPPARGRALGSAPALLTAPTESHGSLAFLPPSSASSPALPCPAGAMCPGPSVALLFGPVRPGPALRVAHIQHCTSPALPPSS